MSKGDLLSKKYNFKILYLEFRRKAKLNKYKSDRFWSKLPKVDILNDDGTIKDWGFIKEWLEIS